DYTKLGLLIGLYFLPGIAIAYPGGLLGQYFGDKRIALFGMALMVAGGLLTAFCNNYAGLFVGRLTSGTGAVLLNVLLTKMTTDWFANREIGTALGLLVSSWPIGIGHRIGHNALACRSCLGCHGVRQHGRGCGVGAVPDCGDLSRSPRRGCIAA